MSVFIYPRNAEALARVRVHCTELDMAAPGIWTHTELHRELGRLIEREPAAGATPSDSVLEIGGTIAGLVESVIVFDNLPQSAIRAMFKKYKEVGEWPVFAVATPMSRHMPLAVLFEYLMADRHKENKVKAATEDGQRRS